ncbi:MAG: hypothetical protein JNL42_08650 [Anaerolineae bacterium]|nr:hypothetical protein [Anaerolineae bacterium]
MTPYTFSRLNDHLVMISWQRSPRSDEAKQYITDLTRLLDDSPEPLFFISDMRKGRIMEMSIIKQLSELARHPHWAGSTAFTETSLSRMFGEDYRRMVVADKVDRNQIFREPEQALAYLETLCPGLTAGVDWEALLG